MAENTILDATVKIKIDNSTIDKQLNVTSKKIETALSKADAKLSKQLTKQIDKDLGRISRSFEKGADKLSKGLEKGLKFGVGAGTAALFAFLKSGTPEAQKFASSLDRVKIAWAKVGQTLATKIDFKGKNLTEWVDYVAKKIENLDVSQIAKIVDYFKIAAATWAGIKMFQGVSALAGFANNLQSIYKGFKGLSALGGAGQIGSEVLRTGLTAGGAVAGGAAIPALAQLKRNRINNAIDSLTKTGQDGPRYSYSKGALEAGVNPDTNVFSNRIRNRIRASMGKEPIPMPGPSRYTAAKDFLTKSRSVSDFIPESWSNNLSKYGRGGAKFLGVAGTAYDSYNTYSDYRKQGMGRGMSLSNTLGSTSSGLATGALGLKLGAALGTAIAPGVGTAIGGVIGSVVGYVAGSAGYKKLQDWAVGTSNIGTREEGIAAAQRLIDAKRLGAGQGKGLFTSNQDKMGISEPFRQLERSYIGNIIPLSERNKLMPSIPANIADMEERINNLKAEIPEGADITQYTTINEEVQALETLIDGLKKFAADTKSLSEKIAETKEDIAEKFKDSMQKISDNIQESKDNLKQKLEDFDFDVASRQTARAEAADYKAFQEGNKPLSTSISMGGDIGSIGAIISQGLNDANNAKAQSDADARQKQIDVAIEAKDELIASRAEAKERDRILAEFNKRQEELEKERLQVEKDQLKAQKDLVKNTGGPSTVTVN